MTFLYHSNEKSENELYENKQISKKDFIHTTRLNVSERYRPGKLLSKCDHFPETEYKTVVN